MLLNAKIDDKGIKCTFNGSIMDMIRMITLLVSNLYRQLPEEFEKGLFKFALTKAFADGMPFASTPEEMQNIADKTDEELKSAKATSDIVDEFMKMLKGKGLKDD